MLPTQLMLTQRQLIRFWLPLFASWLLMTAEGPMISAVINRLPNEVIMLAAQGIVVSLAVTIESPIINLLATSTALVKDRQSFIQVRRFTWHWMAGLTLLAVLLAYTPLFDWVVVRAMRAPDAVATWVRPGLRLLCLWPAAIAWRRFLQGVLIHFGRPQAVARGTMWRLGAGTLTAVLLAWLTDLPGVVVGSITLQVAVIVEALYATWAVQPLLRGSLAAESPSLPGASPLAYRDLFWFHLPLASTSLLTLLVRPLVAFSLARLDNPTRSLAAWPLLFQLLLLARASAMALPEVIIALNQTPQAGDALRRFIIRLAGVNGLLILLLAFTPISTLYLVSIQDATAEVSAQARYGLMILALFPAVATLNFGLRGFLISRRHTPPVNTGMALNLIITALLLTVGVWWRAPSILLAGVALNAALLVETVYLAWQAQQRLVVNWRPQPGRVLPGP